MRQPKLMVKFAKERDLECHVRKLTIFDTEFVEVRDFIPSTKTYARGFLIEAQHLDRLIEALQTTREHVGIPTGSREAGRNQGALL